MYVMGNSEGNTVVESNRSLNQMVASSSFKEHSPFPDHEDKLMSASSFIGSDSKSISSNEESQCCTQLKGRVLAVPFNSYSNKSTAVDLTIKKHKSDHQNEEVSQTAIEGLVAIVC